MKKIILLVFVSIHSLILFAGKIDEKILKKITGTKWELVGEKKYDGMFSHKNKNPAEETITFLEGTIFFDLPDAHYACDYKLKNKFEFWLTCSEPEQYIYKVHSLNNRELVIDVFFKTAKGNYADRKSVV